MESQTTRVFRSGSSQAVQIPAEFCLDTDLVQISRTTEGDLILHPLPQVRDRGQALLAALEGFDADFIAAVEEDLARQPVMQDRECL